MEGKEVIKTVIYLHFLGKKTPTTVTSFHIFLPTPNKTSCQTTSMKNGVNVKNCLCRETAQMLDRRSGFHLINP